MKRAHSETLSTPEPPATRYKSQIEKLWMVHERILNPPIINHMNDEPLLAEATKLANGFLECRGFHDLLVRLNVDHSTVVEQAKKVTVNFASPVATNDKDDSRHSWAWANKDLGLTNVHVFINIALKNQLPKFNVAPGSSEWKKYVYMIAVLIFHEISHLCLCWKGVYSCDIDIEEMGDKAEQSTFGSTFRFIFDKKPREKAGRGKWIIDDSIKLIDIVQSCWPNKPLTDCYIQQAYDYTVNGQKDKFDLSFVVVEMTDKKFNKESWRSRQIDEPTADIQSSSPVKGYIIGWCTKAIERGLDRDYEEDDDEDDSTEDEEGSINDDEQSEED